MDTADAERHYATRNDFCHMSHLEWQAMQRIGEAVGDVAVDSMLLSLSKDEKHATIAKLIQHKLDEAMKISPCYSNKMFNKLTCSENKVFNKLTAETVGFSAA